MNATLVHNINNAYTNLFGDNFITISSPGRINIIGEHTDYNDGFVLPAAINKGIVTSIGKSEDNLCHALAFDVNESYSFSLNDIKSISKGNWRNFIVGVVAEIQKRGLTIAPFNIVFGGDIPNGAGLSSSAALENSVVFGLNKVFNLGLTKAEMILISQHAEHNYVGVRCGIMDQYASMFGEVNHALLLDCRTQRSKPVKINFEGYQIVLINSNVSHSLVDAEYNDRREVCEKVASLLHIEALRDASEDDLLKIKTQISENDFQKALYIIEENKRVVKAAQMIEENNLHELGKLLYEAHFGAQHQFKISCKELDFLVEKAKENKNVLGARMMGGGFGGCTINIVKKEAIEAYTKNVSNQYLSEFGFECSIYFVKLSEGTHLTPKIFQN